jgi:hypothetical protein
MKLRLFQMWRVSLLLGQIQMEITGSSVDKVEEMFQVLFGFGAETNGLNSRAHQSHSSQTKGHQTEENRMYKASQREAMLFCGEILSRASLCFLGDLIPEKTG